MTYSLIDNATITGVQRIIGEVKTRSRDSVDTDIIALENLIQSILFYDKIVALDNYIPKHREQRIKDFPYIEFIDPTVYNLHDIETKAYEESSKLNPEIRGGEFVNENFREFFNILKTHIMSYLGY